MSIEKNPYPELIEILFERDWSQGGLEHPDGSVCLLGARCVQLGATQVNEVTYDQLDKDPVVFHMATNAMKRAPWLTRFKEAAPSNTVYDFNDYNATNFDDIIDFLEACGKDWETNRARRDT